MRMCHELGEPSVGTVCGDRAHARQSALAVVPCASVSGSATLAVAPRECFLSSASPLQVSYDIEALSLWRRANVS